MIFGNPLRILVLATAAQSLTAMAGDYRENIKAAAPVLHYDFEGGVPTGSTVAGAVEFGSAGPVSKDGEFLPEENKAATFSGNGSRIVTSDPGAGSQFDFENGDPITIECWVKATEITNGGHAYIIGKGRTGNSGFKVDNQNWALRLTGENGVGVPNFLFRSRDGKAMKGDYHRWKALGGMAADSKWHHVAVTYVFGKPESIKAWVDGIALQGIWDMGGETTQEPYVDDDEVWIGSTMGGSATNSFHGGLDELAVYRREFDERLLASRVRLPAPKHLTDRAEIPDGKVLVEIVENLGVKKQWPIRTSGPDSSQQFVDDYFALYDLPQKYNSKGLREDRSNPFLVRQSARITIPDGDLRIALRTRGAGRLYLDGKVIAETKFPTTGGGAHHSVPDVTQRLAPNMRIVGPGDRETSVTLKGDGKEHLIVLETIVGNGSARATLGETSVSLSMGDGEFRLLSTADDEVWLTKKGWDQFRESRRDFYRNLDTEKRRVAAADNGEYWMKRHDFASGIVNTTMKSGDIDALLKSSWEEAAKGGNDDPLAKEVHAIFSEKCYRCHGEKVKGGLRLDDHELMLKGGDSELPAVVEGNVKESYLVEVTHPDAEDRMPPKGDALSEKERDVISKWIEKGASRLDRVVSATEPSLVVSDLNFLRRATLDTVGVVPTPEEIDAFLAEPEAVRRANAIDRLLADHRWADHWVSYWQDVLAENPNILKPTQNNTGPFRFWIYESLLDNKPMDQFVTELVKMEGSEYGGGPAGFAMASQNDVPMAAKAHTIGTAFLGVEMKCARCHDAPYNESTQRDLFELAAMLKKGNIKLPKSSTVPAGSIPTTRKSLITMTLKAGETIQPKWPFADLVPETENPEWVELDDPRENVAWMITSPHNERFPQVIVNRVWKRLLGAGFVEPVSDWEAGKPSHPELLGRLADHFVTTGYDLKELVRVVMNSETYQRESRAISGGEEPTFSHQIERRMSAEQVVDSLFSVAGKPLTSEELTMDNDGTQASKTMISLGYPSRAWEFTSLSNERDRPSLAIPKAQAIVDVLENFGWRSSRAEPDSERETEPNVRQSAIVANGFVGRWVTTLSEDHALTKLAMQPDITLDNFITKTFQRVLTRDPSENERVLYAELLSEGFGSRIIPEAERPEQKKRETLGHVSWSNHLSPEANKIQNEMEKRAAVGDFPVAALRPAWRESVEDMLWAMLNSPEFIFLP